MTMFRARVWAGLGSCLLAAAPVSAAVPALPEINAATAAALAAGGEGGEWGGEGGVVPSSYRLYSADPLAWNFDAGPQQRAYAALVHAAYLDAAQQAQRLQQAVEAFLARPSARTLAAARRAWIEARPAYLMTEAFRYYDGPIDMDPSGQPGPESRLNAWPLNEAFIDYVRGAPQAGIIQDGQVPLTLESLLLRDQASDESDVTTGWHAIEFLLWGQDHRRDGPGQRPHSDYLAGTPATARRRDYLRLVTQMLGADLAALAAHWAPDVATNYRARFEALPPPEALGRMLNGMANLAGYELASERLAVALDSGDPEDEHSCFSDNTHNDQLYDLLGVRRVYEHGGEASLAALARRLDPVLAARLQQQFDQAEAAIRAIPAPFDALLATAPGSPARQRAEAAVEALYVLTRSLRDLGLTLGVRVIVSG